MTPAQIHEIVYTKKTRFKKGLTGDEIRSLLKKFSSVTERDFNKAMGVTTVQVIKGEVVYFHCDVETALLCCIEKRELKPVEWD